MNNGEQTMVISFGPGAESAEAFERLCDEVEVVLEKEAMGTLERHEIKEDLSAGEIELCGPDAEMMLKVVRPVLMQDGFMQGAKAILRTGDNNSENTVDL